MEGDVVSLVGISSGFSLENRIERSVKAARVIPHFPARPLFVMGCPGESENTCRIIFTQVQGASDYRLYMSTDGVDYSPLSVLASFSDEYGTFDIDAPANAYYYVRAVDEQGIEGDTSDVIYARITDPTVGLTVGSPEYGNQWVPCWPSMSWDSVRGAAFYGAEIREWSDPPELGSVLWGLIARNPWATYGQKDGCLEYAPPFEPLMSNTMYYLSVYAIDAGRWLFARSDYIPFTTMPMYVEE